MSKGFVYAVPNKWGLQGWTLFEIENINLDLMVDALNCAYKEVAPKKKISDLLL